MIEELVLFSLAAVLLSLGVWTQFKANRRMARDRSASLMSAEEDNNSLTEFIFVCGNGQYSRQEDGRFTRTREHDMQYLVQPCTPLQYDEIVYYTDHQLECEKDLILPSVMLQNAKDIAEAADHACTIDHHSTSGPGMWYFYSNMPCIQYDTQLIEPSTIDCTEIGIKHTIFQRSDGDFDNSGCSEFVV